MKFLSSLLALLLGLASAHAQTGVWSPVPPAELQQAAGLVEPDADAEAIYWEVRITDSWSRPAGWQSKFEHYLKVKILNERGRERFAKFEIPYGSVGGDAKFTLKDIAARTTRADGTTEELKPADIFDNDVARVDNTKVKAKTFVVPGVAPGAVVEFRWVEMRNKTYNYSRIMLARDIPVQRVKYYVRPANVNWVAMRLQSFNVTSGFEREPNGSYSITMKDVPAFRSEPYMPSEYDVKPWVLVYYDSDDDRISAEEYWRDHGKLEFETHKAWLKPNADIKAAAAKAVGDAADETEKLRRIYKFVLANIKDVDDDEHGYTAEERDKIKENKQPSDALKSGTGTWHDSAMVFGAMAVAAGFDARVACAAARDDARFDRKFANEYFVRNEIIAVKTSAGWSFFNLAERGLPFGMIYWTLEGQSVLISDPKEPFWTEVPTSPAIDTGVARKAAFTLSEDGALEGDVTLTYSGHFAVNYRERDDDDTPAEREKSMTAVVRGLVGSTAELTNFRVENIAEPDKPMVYTFHLSVPNYAEKTGRRLFLQPNIFRRATGPAFSSAKRAYDVSISYPWTEQDDISIALPAGYSAETIESPKPVREARNDASLTTTVAVADEGRRLLYKRRFAFGKPGALVTYYFNYGGIKALFDAFHKSDTQLLVLRADAAKTQ